MNVSALKALISFWNITTHTVLIKICEMGYSLLDISEIVGLPTYGEQYDEHIPHNEIINEDPLLKKLMDVHKSIRLANTSHNKKNYCGFDIWVDEFVNLPANEEQENRRRDFAHPFDPFKLLHMNEEGEEVYKEYDTPYSASGKSEYSEELFLAATLALWLSFFVVPNSEGNEVRIEIFPMARGIRTTMGLSCLSSIYTRLDIVTDKKKPPQFKKGELQIHYMLDG